MGLWDSLKKEVRRNFIARPDTAKGHILYKHPDRNIRQGTELTVGADEVAIFVRDGMVKGTLGPGRHTLNSDSVPFLGMLIDYATGGNLYLAELYFVTTREIPSIKFGGPIGELLDPQTQLVVGTMVFGEFSLRVSAPEKLLLGLVGLRRSSDDEILAWFRQLFQRTIKDTIAELIVKKNWPLLQVTSGAYTEEICEEVVGRAVPVLEAYGVLPVNLGNFHVNLKEEDADHLKKLARDTAMSRMAGGYHNYAMGEAMLRGGGGGGENAGVNLMGMMMAKQMMQGAGSGQPLASPFPGQPAPPEGAPAAPAENGARARLEKLKELLDGGLISQAEFEEKRKEILSSL